MRHYLRFFFNWWIDISIHALTRSAMQLVKCSNSTSHISIRALTRSATYLLLVVIISRSYFNPRTHEECDYAKSRELLPYNLFQSTHPRRVRQLKKYASQIGLDISIHAPARSATFKVYIDIFPKTYFNPRTREGCDLNLPLEFLTSIKFQSTHSRGVRQL